ncbi:MAG: Glucosamine-6-phosphate deaminase [Verrucomicrobia subdivision 3 bacterium]|nr:Glucosamine-6-phosphate deaminase [Limisphaerales bacterium]MCS1415497.1 Glucosamine-6-phosphate deaminase [Limisphaerales bacterium]
MTNTTPGPEPENLERTMSVDSLPVRIFQDQRAMAAAAAAEVGAYLRDLMSGKESLRIILATGNSQILFLSRLIEDSGIDWSRIEIFHMDEYLGLPADHSASFRQYMKDRVESLVKSKALHYLAGDALLPLDECKRYSDLLAESPIDLCCLGVGENGHIAFNDPPVADFEDIHWVKIVKLDTACKQQQVGEGHFPSLETVPSYALTLTIPALCAAKKIVCLAPESRKREAIRVALREPISTDCPASILRRQPHSTLYLDEDSAALL